MTDFSERLKHLVIRGGTIGIRKWYNNLVAHISFTVRLDSQIVSRIDSAGSRSRNAFISEAVAAKLAQMHEDELRSGFLSLAESDTDVGFTMDAQRRALEIGS